MAQLLPSKTSKADAPHNAQEQRIALARKGMAAGDNLWKANAAVPASPAPSAPAQHLSGMGASTITGIAPQANAKKADALAELPAEVRLRAANYGDGVKDFIARVYQVHKASGDHVECTTADVASVMKMDGARTEQALAALENNGIVAKKFSRLGTFAGYIPGRLA